MNFKTVYLFLLITVLCFSCKSNTNAEKQEQGIETSTLANTQPNIVVLLCDDLGYGDLSSFGHPIIETKNLDKLAETGIKLTSF